MSFKGIKAIVFDLDGTLTDYEAGSEAGLRAALKVFNADRERPLDWETFREAYRAVIDAEAVWSSREGMKLPARESRLRRFRILFDGLGMTPGSILAEMADAYGFGRSNGTMLFPEVREILDYLKPKYTLGIITEGAAQTQRDQIVGLKIGHYFSTIIISGETPWHKPDESLYRFAGVKLEVEMPEILMIGDRYDWDITPAKNVEMKTVLLKRSQINEKNLPDYSGADMVIQNLNELRKLL